MLDDEGILDDEGVIEGMIDEEGMLDEDENTEVDVPLRADEEVTGSELLLLLVVEEVDEGVVEELDTASAENPNRFDVEVVVLTASL
jgi:hypothetical protein